MFNVNHFNEDFHFMTSKPTGIKKNKKTEFYIHSITNGIRLIY